MKMDSGGRSIFRLAVVVCQMIARMDNLTKEFVGGGRSKCFETVDNVGLWSRHSPLTFSDLNSCFPGSMEMHTKCLQILREFVVFCLAAQWCATQHECNDTGFCPSYVHYFIIVSPLLSPIANSSGSTIDNLFVQVPMAPGSILIEQCSSNPCPFCCWLFYGHPLSEFNRLSRQGLALMHLKIPKWG